MSHAPLLLVAPAQPHQSALQYNLSALAEGYTGPVHWFGYGNNGLQHQGLKHLPRHFVAGAWILTAQPLPEQWLKQAIEHKCRVVLLRTPLQRGLTKVDNRYDTWHLDCPHRVLAWWLRPWRGWLWRRRHQHFNALYPAPSTGPASKECLYLLSHHTSPGERELVSEVAQVVALRQQADATLMAPGQLPPDLNHVNLMPLDDTVVNRIQAAGTVISDCWHWLLCAQSQGRPTLALAHPKHPLYRLAKRMGIPCAPLLRHPLTDKILARLPPPRRPEANGLPLVLDQLITPESSASLAADGPTP